jgi:hypothetical protein
LLATLRDHRWQQLTFLAPDSRKPYREALDPILRWFQELQKERPSATRAEGTATRCMPAVPPKTTLADGSETPKAAPVINPRNVFLFKISFNHFYGGLIETNCTVVFPDGNYHRESIKANTSGEQKDRVFEGHLESAAVASLKTLLEASELKNSPSNRSEVHSDLARESQLTALDVLRGNTVQHLVFVSSFNARTPINEVGGRSNLGNHIADGKLLKPLQQWIKANLDDHAGATQIVRPPDRCAPINSNLHDEKALNPPAM